jgi:hypothetical protein
MDLVEELSEKRIDGVTDSTLGTNLGRHLVCLAETVILSGPWFQTAKRSQCVCVGGGGVRCDGLPSLETQPNHLRVSQVRFCCWGRVLIPHSILPSHTEGH